MKELVEAMPWLKELISATDPDEVTTDQDVEIEKILDVSDTISGHGIAIDQSTEIVLGDAAKLAGNTDRAKQHFQRALKVSREHK